MDMFELYKTSIGEVVGRYSELCLYACVLREVVLLQYLYNWTTYRHPSTRMYPLRTNRVGPSTQIVWTVLTSKIPPDSFAPPSCWREQDGRLPKCKGPRHSPTWPCYAWVDSSFRHVEQDRCGSDALNFEPWWNTVWWRLNVFLKKYIHWYKIAINTTVRSAVNYPQFPNMQIIYTHVLRIELWPKRN